MIKIDALVWIIIAKKLQTLQFTFHKLMTIFKSSPRDWTHKTGHQHVCKGCICCGISCWTWPLSSVEDTGWTKNNKKHHSKELLCKSLLHWKCKIVNSRMCLCTFCVSTQNAYDFRLVCLCMYVCQQEFYVINNNNSETAATWLQVTRRLCLYCVFQHQTWRHTLIVLQRGDCLNCSHWA